MKELAVLGPAEFTLGFRLTGIRKIFTTENNQEKLVGDLTHLLESKEIGIVLIEEKIMGDLEEHWKEKVLESLTPVFVTISATAAQDELRKMILQSIGVDLLKEEN